MPVQCAPSIHRLQLLRAKWTTRRQVPCISKLDPTLETNRSCSYPRGTLAIYPPPWSCRWPYWWPCFTQILWFSQGIDILQSTATDPCFIPRWPRYYRKKKFTCSPSFGPLVVEMILIWWENLERPPVGCHHSLRHLEWVPIVKHWIGKGRVG